MSTTITEDCKNIQALCSQLCRAGQAVKIMEICGTHTMAIARSGLRSLLPPNLKLVSGPGCPVCVTDQSYMDQAVYLATGGDDGIDGGRGGREFPAPIIATYGDMVRVPGRLGSLGDARSRGAAVEVVYSADQAVELAKRTPDRQVVFLGVGFETTAPGSALAIKRAKAEGLGNFSVLSAHKIILPAMRALLDAGDMQVDGFLCPGHVSVMLGYQAYAPIAARYSRPCVVAGFDVANIVLGIIEILTQLRDGRATACSVYPSVSAGGNCLAMQLLDEVFMPGDAIWRALGTIPGSGLAIRPEFAAFDAQKRFALPEVPSYDLPLCRCGEVIRGRISPRQCSLFGQACTPRDPVGPCMVSSEGPCAAAYKYESNR
jgi:hydrogenase expression/formation protein HypD